MYPIALEAFEICDIPKKFILGVLAAGSFTFPQSMPGSPQVGNAAAMTSLGTAADAALVPMALLFLAFNLLKLHIVPCPVICNILTIGLFWKQLHGKDLKGLLSKAATESVPMTMSVSAVTGFGTIITTSAAFQTMMDVLTGINAHPVIICWISIALLAFLTGGCSTC